MKQLSFIIIILFCSFLPTLAQNYTIKGSVKDTLNDVPLHRASIVVIRYADSVIETHTRTAPNGKFELHVSNKGKYMLRISFPGFVDYLEVLEIKKNTTDVGEKPLISKAHLLKEFVLTQQVAAIKIKGDTTEYMADSFKVKENATVEDLLKRLPGIQVDKNGNITAQGETVQKILVDGEEFFSDDPKVVTQNLQADAVKKVQVYNKKSDQAEFTGIDDGQKTKTINLELKEEKKKGYFGKLDAGGGTDNYYLGQGMINAFKAKRQASAFAIASNTDKAGLGWQDNDKFGNGGRDAQFVDGVMFTTGSPDNNDFSGYNGKYNGQGFPQTITGGAHFADKWGKNHTTENYRYGQQQVDISGSNMIQNVLPDASRIVYDKHRTQANRAERHSIDAMYEIKIDTNTSIKVSADAGRKNTNSNTNDSTASYILDTGNARTPINTNTRSILSKGTAEYVNANILLRKKFAKKGRTISLDVREEYRNSKDTGSLRSNIAFDVPGVNDSGFNQRKDISSTTLGLAAKVAYTEPISKRIYAEVNYGINVNNNDGHNYSYNIDKGDSLDYNFSSHFTYNVLSNTGGLNFKYVSEKFNVSLGSDVSNTDYRQTNKLYHDTSHTFTYVNLMPSVDFAYNLSKQTSIKIRYAGRTIQPTFAQTQPLRQNTDPLNITIGNPDLVQGFSHKFDLRFNDYKVLSNRYLWGNVSFTYKDNNIGVKQAFINGVNTTQFINVQGNYMGWAFIGYGFKIKKLNLDVGLQFNPTLYHANDSIGTQDITGKVTYRRNSTDNSSISIAPYFSHNKVDKYELTLEPRYTYHSNTSSIGTNSTTYSTYECGFRGNVQLPLKFEIGSSVDVMIREKTAVFTTNNNVVKWNAWVGKKFLKKSQLELRLSVFDILNQNIGFSRTAQGNTITQDSYNTIRRYGMLNLIWNFTHTPAGAPQSNSSMMIIK